MRAPSACAVCASTKTEHWAVAEDWEYRTSDEKFDYFRCHACGVLFIDPAPTDRLRQIYPPNYYSFAAQERSFIARIKSWLDVRLFRSILRQLPSPSLRVLDVGGGSGWQLNLVRESDPRVSMTQIVDIDPGAGEMAEKRGHSYFCGTIERFDREEKFDLVLLLNIIEHVERPDKVLDRVKSLLAPGGVALIKTPNYDALDARIFRHANWAGYHCPRHWVLFTRESFESLATRSGLRVEKFAFTQGAPFWTASVLGSMARRKWVEITREKPVVYHRLFPLLNGLFAAFDFLRMPLAKTSQMFFVLKGA